MATPGYQVLSPATKIKLATMPKGELMVRHPHFTQPVFLRFPRPAVLPGNVGKERFPPKPDLPFADAVALRLRRLDPRTPLNRVKDLCADREPDEVLAALHEAERHEPRDVLAFFQSRLRKKIRTERVQAAEEAGRPVPVPEDPYA